MGSRLRRATTILPGILCDGAYSKNKVMPWMSSVSFGGCLALTSSRWLLGKVFGLEVSWRFALWSICGFLGHVSRMCSQIKENGVKLLRV